MKPFNIASDLEIFRECKGRKGRPNIFGPAWMKLGKKIYQVFVSCKYSARVKLAGSQPLAILYIPGLLAPPQNPPLAIMRGISDCNVMHKTVLSIISQVFDLSFL